MRMINDNRVANGEEDQHPHQLVMLFLISYSMLAEYLEQRRINKIHVCFLLALIGAVIGAVGVKACRKFPEFHDIAGQCARLVREDILDLSELLVEVTRLRPTLVILLAIVVDHAAVIIHHRSLKQFDHLERCEKTDRDEVGEDEDPVSNI